MCAAKLGNIVPVFIFCTGDRIYRVIIHVKYIYNLKLASSLSHVLLLVFIFSLYT